MIFCRIDTNGDGVFIGEGITYETSYNDAASRADISLDGEAAITFWKADKVRMNITRKIEFNPVE